MNWMMKIAALFVVLVSVSCAKKALPPVKIAINAWPGYEFLYLAEVKGFFKEEGLNISIVQLESLADSQRAYVSGYVDGIASTIVEVVQAQALAGRPLNVVLAADYSNGGDVILAETSYASLEELKGKTVGCEVSSLGIFMLLRALDSVNMNHDDVNIVHTEQYEGLTALNEGQIDAFVSYPPASIRVMQSGPYHQLFSSAQIPFEILDTVSVAEEVLNNTPEFVAKLHRAWQKSLDYYNTNQQEALGIMAAREKISTKEFEAVLAGLIILDQSQQNNIIGGKNELQKKAIEVCHVMKKFGVLNANCNDLPSIVYQGSI